jgi:hypothetical protein
VIFFVPGYDPATRANLAVAVLILPADGIPLLGEDATRSALLAALADDSPSERPLFAMSHGRFSRLLAQGGETALSDGEVGLLGGRVSFAYACHTASDLGRLAADQGGVWWGYTGAITAPDVSPLFSPLFGKIFSFIRDTFAVAHSRAAREAVLLRIAELCQAAEREVDELLDMDDDLDVTTAYLCLLHIWQRLRVWETGRNIPLQHPASPPPSLF